MYSFIYESISSIPLSANNCMNNEAVALLCGKLFKCAFLLTMFNEIEIILLNYSQFQYNVQYRIPSSYHEI